MTGFCRQKGDKIRVFVLKIQGAKTTFFLAINNRLPPLKGLDDIVSDSLIKKEGFAYNLEGKTPQKSIEFFPLTMSIDNQRVDPRQFLRISAEDFLDKTSTHPRQNHRIDLRVY